MVYSQMLRCAVLFLWVLIPLVAQADDDYIVYSPHVVRGQSEIEFRGYVANDTRPGIAPSNGTLLSLAHTFSDVWKSEIYLSEYQHQDGSGNTLYGHEWENTFQLSQRGEYVVDWGFLAAYAQHTLPNVADTLEFGPLIEKDSGPIQQRLNVLCEKDISSHATGRYALRGSYAFSYRVSRLWHAGLEAYYRPLDNAHQVGPMMNGEWFLPGGREVEYSFGVLKGLNNGAPQQVFIARIAFEFF